MPRSHPGRCARAGGGQRPHGAGHRVDAAAPRTPSRAPRRVPSGASAAPARPAHPGCGSAQGAPATGGIRSTGACLPSGRAPAHPRMVEGAAPRDAPLQRSGAALARQLRRFARCRVQDLAAAACRGEKPLPAATARLLRRPPVPLPAHERRRREVGGEQRPRALCGRHAACGPSFCARPAGSGWK